MPKILIEEKRISSLQYEVIGPDHYLISRKAPTIIVPADEIEQPIVLVELTHEKLAEWQAIELSYQKYMAELHQLWVDAAKIGDNFYS